LDVENGNAGGASFEVEKIHDAMNSEEALAHAAQMNLHHTSYARNPKWRQVLAEPEVYVSNLARADDPVPGTHLKMIVARSADGTYIRIGLLTNGAPDALAAYDEIMNAVARSISTVPAPTVLQLLLTRRTTMGESGTTRRNGSTSQ
jgi:hypothetical protein